MKFCSGDRLPENCTAVIRFLKEDSGICFRCDALRRAWEAQFSGDTLSIPKHENAVLRMRIGSRFLNVLIVCAGRDEGDLYRTALNAGEWLRNEKATSAYIEAEPEHDLGEIGRAIALCMYRFDRYLTDVKPIELKEVTVFAQRAEEAAALREGVLLAECVTHCRDMVNDIAWHMTPEALANTAAQLGNRYGFETEILERSDCEALGMGLFMAVASGSALPPKLIILRWNGEPDSDRCIGFVGKGITYDSGGYNIKTSGMDKMRYDMNGAAAVIGAFCAIAEAGIRKNAVAVIAACENMVDANSCRSGDVFKSMNGRTVLVRNTDAEGRLTMADAITYCVRRFHPTELIECAGLTGSVCNFYGTVCAATLPTDIRLHERFASLAEVTHERYAMMPTFPEYKALLKTPFADLNSAPEGACGGITAALFLCEFAEDTPFISIDFGAMPFTSKASPGQPEGATGFGVCSLYEYMKRRAAGNGIWADL